MDTLCIYIQPYLKVSALFTSTSPFVYDFVLFKCICIYMFLRRWRKRVCELGRLPEVQFLLDEFNITVQGKLFITLHGPVMVRSWHTEKLMFCNISCERQVCAQHSASKCTHFWQPLGKLGTKSQVGDWFWWRFYVCVYRLCIFKHPVRTGIARRNVKPSKPLNILHCYRFSRFHFDNFILA